MPPRRLDQILSSFGYCSRSEARGWVRAGRVLVDGEAARAHDQKVSAGPLLIDGEAIECPDGILAVFHKPAGYVCSQDSREGPSVYDLLPAGWNRRHPPVTTIGRLDKDTTGVLLVTDVGELVQRGTSPRRKLPKLYDVTVDADLRDGLIPVFASGALMLEGETTPCASARLEILNAREARLELTEGRYHQVKRMFSSQGYVVTKLHRSRFGNFDVEGLAAGE